MWIKSKLNSRLGRRVLAAAQLIIGVVVLYPVLHAVFFEPFSMREFVKWSVAVALAVLYFLSHEFAHALFFKFIGVKYHYEKRITLNLRFAVVPEGELPAKVYLASLFAPQIVPLAMLAVGALTGYIDAFLWAFIMHLLPSMGDFAYAVETAISGAAKVKAERDGDYSYLKLYIPK